MAALGGLVIKTCSRLIKTCSRLWEGGVVLAGVKAKPCGWPSASLTPAPGDTDMSNRREQAGDARSRGFGGMLWSSVWGLVWASRCRF